MLLFWLFTFLQAKKSKDSNDSKGAYIINYKVHINIPAHLSVINYMNSISKKTYVGRQATEVFFNDIFDSINLTLEPNHVQIKADYSKLLFEELPISLTPDKICQTNNAVGLINKAAKINLAWPFTLGVGNRIIIYKCLFGPKNQVSYITERIAGCGSLSIIHMNRPTDVMKVLSDIIEGSLTYDASWDNSPTSDDYKDNLKKYVKTCAVENDYIGKFKDGLINLKNNNRSRSFEIEGQRK